MLGKFKLAKKKHFTALSLYRSLYQYSEEASCIDNIGVLYMKQANFKLALEYFFVAHTMKKKYSTNRRLAITKHNIGEVYYLLGKNKEALQWLCEAQKMFKNEKLFLYLEPVEKMIIKLKKNCT